MAKAGIIPRSRTTRAMTAVLWRADGAASFVFGAGALWLAAAGPDLLSPSALAAAGWGWLAGIVAATIAHEVVTLRTSPMLRRFLPAPPFAVARHVAGLSALAAASLLLFAIGETVTAVAIEILFFLRLGRARNKVEGPPGYRRRRRGEREAQWWSVAYERFALALGASWIALGTPPGWLAAAVVAGLWIAAVLYLMGAMVGGVVDLNLSTPNPPVDQRFKPLFRRLSGPRPASDYPPEPERHWLNRLLRWPFRLAATAAVWALWTTDRPWLAIVYALSILAFIAWDVAHRRWLYGPAARTDPISRAIHGALRLPMKVGGYLFIGCAVAVAAVAAVPAAPVMLLAKCLGAFMPFAREKRRRENALLEAADGARLCAAFGQPDGFIYFLHSAAHQHDYFLADDGVLMRSRLPVVVRNWPQEVRPLRDELGSRVFGETPEGALLRFARFGTWFDSIPLVVVVPPDGAPAAHNFAGAYRYRADSPELMNNAEAALATTISEMTRSGRIARSA